MCDPTGGMIMAAVSTAIGIATSMAQRSAQQSAAAAQERAANKATVNAYEGATLRQNQERDKAAMEQFDIGLQMANAKATARASAGETGTAEGGSFNALLRDYEARGGRATDTIEANYEMTKDALQSEKEGAQAKGQLMINSIQQPSTLGMFADVGAKLAMGGLKIYDISNKKV